jgi:hypothetical protein
MSMHSNYTMDCEYWASNKGDELTQPECRIGVCRAGPASALEALRRGPSSDRCGGLEVSSLPSKATDAQ